MDKTCLNCGKKLEQKPRETIARFKVRTHCGFKCANTLNSKSRIKAREKIETDGHKVCTICGTDKPLLDFPKKANVKGGLKGASYYQTYCIECTKELKTEIRLRKLFNISVDERDKILTFQNNSCAICGKPNNTDRNLHIDHDHKTGLIRGMLCWFCNKALGYFKDNPEFLRNAANYIDKPPASTCLGESRIGCVGRTTSKASKARIIDFDVLAFLKEKYKEKLNN